VDQSNLAELTRGPDGAVVARLTRRLEHPPEVVWLTLTDAAKLPGWLAPGRIEAAIGGAVRLDFADSGTVIESRVTGFEPGRLVEYSWSKPGEPLRPVRFEIAPEDAATRLTLTVTMPAGEDPGRACAGWEAHLAMLQAALANAPVPFPFETFKAAREAYRAKVATL